MSPILFAILALIFAYIIRKYVQFRANVNQFPGPPVRSWLLGNLHDFTKPSGMSRDEYLPKFYNYMGNIFDRFRKDGVFRFWIGPFNPVYILTNAESVENLLSSHINVNKGAEYKFLSAWLGDGLLVSESSTWRMRRKLLVTGFHVKILQDFLPIFKTHTDIVLEQIEQSCKEAAPKEGVIADIRPMYEDCTLNIVKETSFGLDPYHNQNSNATYREALKNAFFLAVVRVMRPAIWIDFIFRLTERGKKFYRNIHFLDEYAKNVINKRMQFLREEDTNNNNNNNNVDSGFDDEDTDSEKNSKGRSMAMENSLNGRIIIDILLKRYLEQSPSDEMPLSPQIIKSEVNTFILGGHDTTAMALTFTTLMIGHHVEVQRKVYEELEGIFDGDMSRPLTMADLRQMRYLEQCIKESLRLYPSIQLVGRHLCEPLILPDGKKIPAGSTCYIPIIYLHRDPTHFPEPDKFEPDRFAPENKLSNQYAFIPFSAGPRNCIGQRYAMLELKYVLASVFRKYRVHSKTVPEGMIKGIAPIIKPLTKIEIGFEPIDCNNNSLIS